MEQAFKERLIDFNPASAVKLPRDSKKEMKTLDKGEVKVFLDTAKEQTEKAMEKKDAGACFYYTEVYGHSTNDMKKEAAEKMSTLFIQPIEKENSPSKGATKSNVSF